MSGGRITPSVFRARRSLPHVSSLKNLIFLLIPLAFCSGCASAIYSSGRFSSVLKSGTDRSEIRAALGMPINSGEDRNSNDSPQDEFIVRGAIADRMLAGGASMAAAMTLGLSEFIAVPQAMWWSLTSRGEKRVMVRYTGDLHYLGHSVVPKDRASTHEKGADPANDGAAAASETNNTAARSGSGR